MIQGVAQLLYNVLVESGHRDDFLGHIGGDDFLLLVAPERSEALCTAVLEAFAELSPTFYEERDREQGFIEARDRYGTMRRFPMMSLALASVELEAGCRANLEEIGTFAAQCKKRVKGTPGNSGERFSFSPMAQAPEGA